MKAYLLSKKGFSLIEVLVTVAILSILLSIAVPSYMGYISSSKRSEAKTNLQALGLLLEQRFAENQRYCPAIDTDYAYTENSSGTVTSQTIITNFLTGFRPKLSSSGAAILYDYRIRCTAPTSYTITADDATGRAPVGDLTLNQSGVKSGW